jgi:hypothetical protein
MNTAIIHYSMSSTKDKLDQERLAKGPLTQKRKKNRREVEGDHDLRKPEMRQQRK